MKNLKFLAILFTVTFFHNGYSQIVAGSGRSITGQDLLMSVESGTVVGSPYLDDKLAYGTVILEDDTSLTYFMRYNILNDQIEFSTVNDVAELKSMPYDSSLIFKLGDKRFQYLDFEDQQNGLSGIFEIVEVFDDKNKLLKKYTKTVVKPEGLNQTSYSNKQDPRIVSKEAFYSLEDGALNAIENHKRRSLKYFDSSKEKQLKDFIKDRNIDFDDDGKGLAEIIAYYRSIK